MNDRRLYTMSASRAGASLKNFLLIFSLLVLAACNAGTRPVEERGTLTGTVTVGPLIPVELVDATPAPIPPVVYTSRAIQVFTADGETLLKTEAFQADGTYRVELPPGEYLVKLKPNGIDRAAELPAHIQIHAGETLILDVNIDTGIR